MTHITPGGMPFNELREESAGPKITGQVNAMVRHALARLAGPLDPSNAHSETERQDILIILAGQRHKEIVQPLIDLALHDSDGSSRIEAVKLLATDFPENSAVRTALEKLAFDPSNPELQKIAAAMLSRMSGG